MDSCRSFDTHTYKNNIWLRRRNLAMKISPTFFHPRNRSGFPKIRRKNIDFSANSAPIIDCNTNSESP